MKDDLIESVFRLYRVHRDAMTHAQTPDAQADARRNAALDLRAASMTAQRLRAEGKLSEEQCSEIVAMCTRAFDDLRSTRLATDADCSDLRSAAVEACSCLEHPSAALRQVAEHGFSPASDDPDDDPRARAEQAVLMSEPAHISAKPKTAQNSRFKLDLS